MPQKKKKGGLLSDAWDFLASAGANILGGLGDLEYAVRNPVETLSGLSSLLDPHLKTSTLKELANVPVQDSDTFLPTSDELTSKFGGNPYSLAGIAGGIIGAPFASAKAAKLAKRLKELSALERLEKLGATSEVLENVSSAASKKAGTQAINFGTNITDAGAAETAASVKRGTEWLWGGERNSLLKNPEQIRFDASSLYEPSEFAPLVVIKYPEKKSVWLRGMDWDEAVEQALEGRHIDVKEVSKQLGFDRLLTVEDFQKIRNGLANVLLYGQKIVKRHAQLFYPEARDVIAAAAGGDPVRARQIAIAAGATSPGTSVPSSINRAFGPLSTTDASLIDPNRYVKTSGGTPIKALQNARNRAVNFQPMESPKVGAFTNELDPTVGGLLSAGNVFIGAVNDSHMYGLMLMIAHDALKVDNATGALVLDVEKFNDIKRKIAKNLMSPKEYQEFQQKLAKNPNAVPELRDVSTAMHKYMDGEFALLSKKMGLPDTNTGQAIGWGVKQIVEELGSKKALTPQKALEIANKFSNTFASAWRQETGVMPFEPFYSDKVSTLAETMRKFPMKERNELAAQMGVTSIPGILRDAGLVSPEIIPKAGLRVFEGKTNPVFPIPIGIPSESGRGQLFLDDIKKLIEALSITMGQSANAPGYTIKSGKNAFMFDRPLTQQEVYDIYNKLQGVNVGEKPIAKGIVDRGPFGTILTSFDEGEALPSKKFLEKLTGEKVTPIGYHSKYVEGITSPATGSGQNTKTLLGLLSESPQTRKAFSSPKMREFASAQLNALNEAGKQYGLTRGLGPQFDINTAHVNLLEMIAKAKDATELSDLIQKALKAGIPLPVIIMALEQSKGGSKNESTF